MTLWQRAILHVDMDAFFASIEQLDHPELRGKPIIVGGRASDRGVVAAASYEIRPYGVRSAMPTAKALRLCPHAIIVRPRKDRYAEVSASIFAIFEKITPLVQPVSLDEAFLDISGSQRLYGDPVRIARMIRQTIKAETGLTPSVGVAPCRFVAKIASDLDKPDGLTVIPEDLMLDRLAPMPVSKIWGVGPVTNRRLADLGIHTIGQLRQWPVETLRQELGQVGGDLHRLANGIDPSPVVADEEDKSVSHESTFARDVIAMDQLESELLDHAERVAIRLRRKLLAGRVVCLKLRYNDFTTITRQVTLDHQTDLAATIYSAAKTLLHGKTDAGRRPVRLIGVGVSGFDCEAPVQRSLFAPEATARDDEKLSRLERAADSIRNKLGQSAIQRGTLMLRDDEE